MAEAATKDSWADLEQVVYGSFRDLPGGQRIRFKTSGISGAIAASVVARCDNWGEIRSRVFRRALVTLDLPAHITRGAGRLFMIDGVTNLGVDSAGRPGAQMHHILVLTPDEYRLFGADPFLVAEQGVLAEQWDPARFGSPAHLRVPDVLSQHAKVLAGADQLRLVAGLRIAQCLLDREGCLFWNEQESEDLRLAMRLAWIFLPVPVRMETKLATFAFLNRNNFDMAAIYSDLAPAGPLGVLKPGATLEGFGGQGAASRSYLVDVAMDLSEGKYEDAVRKVASRG